MYAGGCRNNPVLGQAGGGGDARSAALPLPCLSSNNSIQTPPEKVNLLTGGHKRSAFVLAFEIMALARQFGIERLGFFTLTFADLVLDLAEANRRFNSLNTNVLKGRYCRAVAVPERQKSGRVHFHLLVVLGADIRTGCDFEAFERGDYRSANKALRSEWAFWRKTAPLYGFGRHELLPVKSNSEGIARYVGKYISKHVRERVLTDKGARLVRYIGFGPGERKASCRLAWNTDNAWLWRHKLAAFAQRMGLKDVADLQKAFGPRWAWHLQGAIIAEHVTGVFPSEAVARRSVDFDSVLEGKLAFAKFGSGRVYAREFALDGGKLRFVPKPKRWLDDEDMESLRAWSRGKSVCKDSC